MGRLVPWIPRPKLIPERDGMYGVSGDAHLRMEVPGARNDDREKRIPLHAFQHRNAAPFRSSKGCNVVQAWRRFNGQSSYYK